jgi:hypothetical protein
MKKFLIAGLVTVVGALTWVSQADAASRYCIFNPDDPLCDQQDQYDNPPDYQPPDYGNNEDYPPPPPVRHRRRHYQDNSDPFFDNGGGESVFTFQFGSPSRGSCSQIGRNLRRAGFRGVRAIDCAGREYAYIASRDGQRLRVTVSSRNGRIANIRPYRSY